MPTRGGFTGRGLLPLAVWATCVRPHRPGSCYESLAFAFWSVVLNRIGEASKIKARRRLSRRGDVCDWLQRASLRAHHHISEKWTEKHRLVLNEVIEIIGMAKIQPALRLKVGEIRLSAVAGLHRRPSWV